MFRRPIAFVLMAAALYAAPPEPVRADSKAGLDAARLALIAGRMKAFVDRGESPGFVTLVQRNGALAHLEAVGWQDREKKIHMKTDTIFEVMSMTKPITAVAIQMLMEDGLLALTDPVERHLPEFRGQMMTESKDGDRVVLKKPARAITIRDLLTHTSGLAEYPPAGMDGQNFYLRMNKTLAEAVAMFSQMPLQFEPGSKWSYSNPGIATLGRIIEVVSGKPYETFMAQRVFEPLGMKDSFFFPREEFKSRIAAGYQVNAQGKQENMGDLVYRKGAKYPMPEGGLYSTAQDMAAFYQMMLNGGMYNGKRLLSKASVEVMTTVHTANTGSNWGLGWSVVRGARATLGLQSEGSYGHAGAFSTYGWVDPAKKLVGVFMVQLYGGNAHIARNEFVDLASASVVE